MALPGRGLNSSSGSVLQTGDGTTDNAVGRINPLSNGRGMNDATVSLELDTRSLPVPYLDSNSSVEVLVSPPDHDERCVRPSCVQSQRKLSEAMQANRAWERRYNELRRESLRYTQDLERKLRRLREDNEEFGYPEKPRDGSERERELERRFKEQEAKMAAMQERLRFLDGELRTARAECLRERKAGENVHLLQQQLQCYQEDFNTERADRERLQSEKEELRERLVVTQQASTHQANFLAARRGPEKEELLQRLKDSEATVAAMRERLRFLDGELRSARGRLALVREVANVDLLSPQIELESHRECLNTDESVDGEVEENTAACHHQNATSSAKPLTLPVDTLRAENGARCKHPGSVHSQSKLLEAMQGNRDWERRYDELRRESLRCTQELQRDLRCLREEKERHERSGERERDRCSERERDLERQVKEHRGKIANMEERLSCLDVELGDTRAELDRVLQAADEMDLLCEQLRCCREDLGTERAERERLQREKEELRERLVVSQQQASTHQANFLAARREKDELVRQLRRLPRTASDQ